MVQLINLPVDGLDGVGAFGGPWLAIVAWPPCFGTGAIALGADRMS